MKYLFSIFFLLSFSSFSQNEGNIWYFGQNAGLDFNSGSPVALTNGQLNTWEGCATIADNNGDLLFYTDGMTVYNKQHTIMPNGTGLLGHSSSTQSAIIVKKPASNTIYYIFTVDGMNSVNAGSQNGLCYSEIDMSLQGGLGDVNANKNITCNALTCEKVTVIKHQNNSDFWIIVRLDASNTYHAYLLSNSGFNIIPVITNIGIIHSAQGFAGYIKGSSDGNYLAAATLGGTTALELFNFDNSTGTLSNPITLNSGSGSSYGIEFSPNSNILYLGSPPDIFQYNLLAGSPANIISSIINLNSGAYSWALQLGPDDKIYVAEMGINSVGVINNPDVLGTGCNYTASAVNLSSGIANLGLPTFFSSIFVTPVDTCITPQANLPDTIEICDTSITLTADNAYSYLWSTGETTQSITVTQSGDYWVQVCDSTFDEVLVYENDFNSFIGSEWSDNTSSTYNSTTVLGNFNNASTTLSLSNLPAHNSIKAVFDLYLLDSWDGNAGPDIWNLSIDGSSTINTTFANINFGGGIQSYPANYPSANAPLTGVNQIGLPNICYTGINSISSMYKIDSPFSTHSASSASIDFSASGLESSCNESWAIDSVKVYVDSALSCCATEFVHVELTAPNANLGPDILTCDSTWTITANSGYSYLWNTGETTQSIIVDTTGTYQVMICDPLPSCLLPTNLQNGLIAWYPFCGNANDESGNAHHGTVNGATLTVDRFGNANNAYSFNALDYITTPIDSEVEGLSNMSISAWFRWDGIYGASQVAKIVRKKNNIGVGTNRWQLSISSYLSYPWSNDNIVFALEPQAPTNNLGYTNPAVPASLYHIVVVFDGSGLTNTEKLRFYINGVDIPLNYSGNLPSITPSNNFPVTFGESFGGTIDDVGIWNRSLDSTEIQQLYSYSSPSEWSSNITDTLCFPNPDGTMLIGPVWSWSYKDFIIPAGFKIDAVFMNADRPGYPTSSHAFSMSYCPGSTTYNSANEILIIDYSVFSTSMYNTWIDVSMDNVQSTGMVRVLLPTGTSAIWYDLCFAISQTCCATEDINVQIKCPSTTAIITPPTCNADADGSIDLTFVDGTLPQTVVWQNSNNAFISNMPNITNLIAGEYIVSTTCGLNCSSVIDTFIVPEPPALVVPGIKNDISCFGADDGSIDIDIAALLVPVVSTDWTGPNGFSSILEDINNLPPGMYSVLVTDVNSCFLTESFNIKEPDSILPNPLITNVKCNGDFDGSAVLSITGGTEPYNVNWGTANPLNLDAGTHTYTITDGNNCVFTGDVIISEPDPILPNLTTTSVKCHGDSNGTAMLSPTGGTPSYTISWGTSNPAFLPSGPHFYTITDTNNCPYPGVVNISQPGPIVVSPTQQNVSCYGDFDGWCTISIIGGISPYTVDWYGADSLSLSAGTYLYSVSDVNNCILTDSVVITQPDSLKVSYTTTHVQCNGEPTGAIDVSVLFVNPSYSFKWSNLNDPTFIATTEDINNLYAGTYLLIVTDADNCEAELQIVVNQPIAISQYLDIQTSNYTGYDIACKGDNSGWISITVNGGYIPFSYLWSTGATTDSIFDLFAGVYTLTITDGLGCTETVQYSLLEPPLNLTGVIQATTDYNGFNISCFNGSDGGIREIPTGGVPPYAWVWDDTQGGEYLINQMAGYHHVELYDNNNCVWQDNITLTEPPALDIQKISVTDTCDREVGEAYAAVSGGVQDYQYIWSSGDTLSFTTNLAKGTYELIITDANNCTDTAWYNIGNLLSPLIDFSTFPEHKRFFEQLDDPFVFIDNTQGFWQNVEYWYWDFGDNNFGIDSIAFHSYHDTGMYDVSLIIVTEYNCVDTITKSVLVDDYNIYIPNAFTPDDYDERNNIFYVYGYGVNRFLMNIYSRWGELLFESDDITKGWDGRKQGHSEICPTGTYAYYIEIENIYGEIFKFEGQLTLIR